MGRRPFYIFAFFLMGNITTFLTFTPYENVCDRDFYLDAFLEFDFDHEFQSENAVSPILESHPNGNPLVFHFLKATYSQKVDFLTNILRL
jgi:hypothetical protein